MNDSESFDRLAADPDFQRYLGMMVRVMQIIVFALVMGVVIFGVIVLVTKGIPAAALAADGSMIGWIAVGFTAVILAVRPVVMAAAVSAAKRGDFSAPSGAAMPPVVQQVHQRMPMVTRWMQAYQTRLIIGCALLEGAAFFNLVACMAQPWIGNLLAALLLIAGIALHFPTRDRLVDWIGQRIRQSQIEG